MAVGSSSSSASTPRGPRGSGDDAAATARAVGDTAVAPAPAPAPAARKGAWGAREGTEKQSLQEQEQGLSEGPECGGEGPPQEDGDDSRAYGKGPLSSSTKANNARGGGEGEEREWRRNWLPNGGEDGDEENEDHEREQQHQQQQEQPASDSEGVSDLPMLAELRQLARSSLQEGMSAAGSFYADKACSFSGHDREDVLLLARAYRDEGEHLRAVHLVGKHRLLNTSDEFGLRVIHLASRCLVSAKKHEECMKLLEGALGARDEDADELVRHSSMFEHQQTTEGGINLYAALCCVRGQLYATLDYRLRAAIWLKAALHIDARCVEALQLLVKWQLLSADDQQTLLESLSLDGKEGECLRDLYRSMVGAYRSLTPDSKHQAVFKRLEEQGLGSNGDVLASRAEHSYYRSDPRQALELCKALLARDPHNTTCLPIYVASMVELKMKNELFYAAHTLVDTSPTAAVSWFAVGCYYFLLGRHDMAQHYFLKATKLDGRMVAAWIGFGIAAGQDKSDQAVSAYRTAARLFEGCHLPLLYMGIEYLRTDNLSLAQHFLEAAASLHSGDPLVFNELGVILYRKGQYDQAANQFRKVMDMANELPLPLRKAWEGTAFNLGHCHRKLRDLPSALRYYELALAMNATNAGTHAALGLVYQMLGRMDDAIDSYHVALGLEPQDPFASDMLRIALKEALDQPFDDGDDSDALEASIREHIDRTNDLSIGD